MPNLMSSSAQSPKIEYGVPDPWYSTKRADETTFYCPNGHQAYYPLGRIYPFGIRTRKCRMIPDRINALTFAPLYSLVAMVEGCPLQLWSGDHRNERKENCARSKRSGARLTREPGRARERGPDNIRY